jgi:hypothetical protein
MHPGQHARQRVRQHSEYELLARVSHYSECEISDRACHQSESKIGAWVSHYDWGEMRAAVAWFFTDEADGEAAPWPAAAATAAGPAPSCRTTSTFKCKKTLVVTGSSWQADGTVQKSDSFRGHDRLQNL